VFKWLLVALVLLGGCQEPQTGAPCGDGLQCMTVDVPADWNHPTTAYYPLNVVIRPATGDRIGPLFLNFGGPGADTSSYLAVFAAIFPDLADRFDIVAVDPRGTDVNSPLYDCMDGLDG